MKLRCNYRFLLIPCIRPAEYLFKLCYFRMSKNKINTNVCSLLEVKLPQAKIPVTYKVTIRIKGPKEPKGSKFGRK